MNEKIFDQIMVIRDSGLTNMFDVKAVKKIAYDEGFAELCEYIDESPSRYCNFIMFGKDY